MNMRWSSCARDGEEALLRQRHYAAYLHLFRTGDSHMRGARRGNLGLHAWNRNRTTCAPLCSGRLTRTRMQMRRG